MAKEFAAGAQPLRQDWEFQVLRHFHAVVRQNPTQINQALGLPFPADEKNSALSVDLEPLFRDFPPALNWPIFFRAPASRMDRDRRKIDFRGLRKYQHRSWIFEIEAELFERPGQLSSGVIFIADLGRARDQITNSGAL